MKECEVTDLFDRLKDRPEGCVLIDVREYPEYAGGRVSEAKLIPLGAIEKRHNEIDREAAVFLICRSGRRSAEAQVKLAVLGFTDVRNVRGGFEAWQAAGFPVERDPGAVWSLERQVRFAAGTLVFLGVVLAVFVHPYFVVLPAFVGAGLIFAAVTDTCGMAMALARMPWNKGSGAVCDAPPRGA